jgi:hypothetical protein
MSRSFVLSELRRILLFVQNRVEMALVSENSYHKWLAQSSIPAAATGSPALAGQAGRC